MDQMKLTACLKLRSKQDYYTIAEPTDSEREYPQAARYFWCLKTMQPLGPDSDTVNVKRCQPGRECYCSEE